LIALAIHRYPTVRKLDVVVPTGVLLLSLSAHRIYLDAWPWWEHYKWSVTGIVALTLLAWVAVWYTKRRQSGGAAQAGASSATSQTSAPVPVPSVKKWGVWFGWALLLALVMGAVYYGWSEGYFVENIREMAQVKGGGGESSRVLEVVTKEAIKKVPQVNPWKGLWEGVKGYVNDHASVSWLLLIVSLSFLTAFYGGGEYYYRKWRPSIAVVVTVAIVVLMWQNFDEVAAFTKPWRVSETVRQWLPFGPGTIMTVGAIAIGVLVPGCKPVGAAVVAVLTTVLLFLFL